MEKNMSQKPKEKIKKDGKNDSQEVVESPDFDISTECLDCCDVDGCDTGEATNKPVK
jgi:hypothetical protein